MIKSRRIRLVEYVACTGRGGEEEECIQDFGGKARKKETTRNA
jgi:hypothetical protein